MKLSDRLRAKEVIFLTARQFGVTVEEVRRNIQATIDDAWANADPEERQHQLKIFPNGKPTVEEFIIVTATLAQED